MSKYSLIKKENINYKKNENCYKILVVNLKKRSDRKDNIINIFKSANFKKNYLFYKAFDGSEISETLEITELFKINDFGSRKGFIGCALSHYNIWIDLLKDELCKYYIIFEDDITLCNNFTQYFNDVTDIMESFSEKIDILF